MMKKVILFILLGLIAVCSGKTLNFVSLENRPLEYSDAYGAVTGFNIKVVEEAVKRAGHTASFELIPWKRAIALTKKGDKDGIIDISRNSSRESGLQFTDEHIYQENIYLYKAKNRYIVLNEDLSNVKDFTVGVGRGFHYGGVIQKALDGRKFKKIEEVNSYSQNVKKLLIGRVELMVGNDLNVAFEAKMQNVIDDIEQVTLESTGKPYLLSTPKTYCAFSKKVDKSIVDAVSKALKDMKSDGTYDKLKEKYLK